MKKIFSKETKKEEEKHTIDHQRHHSPEGDNAYKVVWAKTIGNKILWKQTDMPSWWGWISKIYSRNERKKINKSQATLSTMFK